MNKSQILGKACILIQFLKADFSILEFIDNPLVSLLEKFEN